MSNISAAIVHARSALALAECDNDNIPDSLLPTWAMALIGLREAIVMLESVAANEAEQQDVGL